MRKIKGKDGEEKGKRNGESGENGESSENGKRRGKGMVKVVKMGMVKMENIGKR